MQAGATPAMYWRRRRGRRTDRVGGLSGHMGCAHISLLHHPLQRTYLLARVSLACAHSWRVSRPDCGTCAGGRALLRMRRLLAAMCEGRHAFAVDGVLAHEQAAETADDGPLVVERFVAINAPPCAPAPHGLCRSCGTSDREKGPRTSPITDNLVCYR